MLTSRVGRGWRSSRVTIDASKAWLPLVEVRSPPPGLDQAPTMAGRQVMQRTFIEPLP